MKTRILTVAALALLAITTTASSASAAWVGVNIGSNGPRPFAPVVVTPRPFAPVVAPRPFAPVVTPRPFVNPPIANINVGPVHVRIR